VISKNFSVGIIQNNSYRKIELPAFGGLKNWRTILKTSTPFLFNFLVYFIS
jgi:hypothetical protein